MAAKFLTQFGSKVKTIFPRKKKLEDLYDINEQLGAGNYAVVKIGTHKKTREQFALKIIEKDKIPDYEKDNLMNEIDILKNYSNHPNIITLKEVYEDRKRLVLIMELMRGGELLEQIRKKKYYSEKEASAIARQIIEAISYLHKNGIDHRDVKPENILFSAEHEDAELKIADFGFAKFIGDGVLSTPCGSPAYVAPEIVREEEYTKAVDMWSVGVIIYILLCGFPPFYAKDTQIIFAQITEGKFDFPDPYWTKISQSAKELIAWMLQMNPKERATADAALDHPWIKGLTASSEKIVLETVAPADTTNEVQRNISSESTSLKQTKKEMETVSNSNTIKSKANSPKDSEGTGSSSDFDESFESIMQ